jgi:SAM-dependent methyltransferase
MMDVRHLNETFPKYPVTVEDKGWVYGVWYCSTAFRKSDLHGQYPATFLKRALALFPSAERILHCPSGTVTGPGMTVDLVRDKIRQPQIVASADRLPFKPCSFDLYLSDPPYNDHHCKIYNCPPYPLRLAMREAHRVLRPGGYFALLHFNWPSFHPSEWQLKGLIGVVTGANRASRIFSLFERQ